MMFGDSHMLTKLGKHTDMLAGCAMKFIMSPPGLKKCIITSEFQFLVFWRGNSNVFHYQRFQIYQVFWYLLSRAHEIINVAINPTSTPIRSHFPGKAVVILVQESQALPQNPVKTHPIRREVVYHLVLPPATYQTYPTILLMNLSIYQVVNPDGCICVPSIYPTIKPIKSYEPSGEPSHVPSEGPSTSVEPSYSP